MILMKEARMKNPGYGCRKGFTLIELLVVLAVLGKR